MKRLVLGLLKLVVQLVLLGLTGTWYRLERPGEARPGPAPAGRERAPRQPGQAPKPKPTRTWTVPDAETIELRGGEQVLVGGELAEALPTRPKRRRGRARPALPSTPAARSQPAPRSLGAALRDRRVVRDAVVLNAALGRRTGRG